MQTNLTRTNYSFFSPKFIILWSFFYEKWLEDKLFDYQDLFKYFLVIVIYTFLLGIKTIDLKNKTVKKKKKIVFRYLQPTDLY